MLPRRSQYSLLFRSTISPLPPDIGILFSQNTVENIFIMYKQTGILDKATSYLELLTYKKI
jgi:hypothetical protein